MAKSEKISEFTEALICSIESVKKAHELPGYLTSKARDVNASHIQKTLLEILEDPENIIEFTKAHNLVKISEREEIRNKEDLWKYLVDMLPAIERVKSGNYKLILDRFIAGHELAVKLYELLEQLYGKDKLKEVSEKNKK
ncbi:MAG: hypothetical protein LW817_02730 [Candidatus Caenarcaniphilales bacterium]|jgi:hypothetical protein|nr:hypothetical protein [Candidatus Caenarcaniphilales bacterium]